MTLHEINFNMKKKIILNIVFIIVHNIVIAIGPKLKQLYHHYSIPNKKKLCI